MIRSPRRRQFQALRAEQEAELQARMALRGAPSQKVRGKAQGLIRVKEWFLRHITPC